MIDWSRAAHLAARGFFVTLGGIAAVSPFLILAALWRSR